MFLDTMFLDTMFLDTMFLDTMFLDTMFLDTMFLDTMRVNSSVITKWTIYICITFTIVNRPVAFLLQSSVAFSQATKYTYVHHKIQ